MHPSTRHQKSGTITIRDPDDESRLSSVDIRNLKRYRDNPHKYYSHYATYWKPVWVRENTMSPEQINELQNNLTILSYSEQE